ncbi:shugoshin 2 isoform X3 [Marmota marmota marmota]|nr:shugoshin 2 isoform X3 [Marmota marmota marmota]
MEYPMMEANSITSGIKRNVKDRRISKTKLNVSLASKIKTKIINNSSIFKISLKHNNRALAQALSREKENSRRITTEKTVLQKEVEKLNFENAFLRLKLNNLNKKLIEIESLMNNNLITAIEMSSLSEFHQNSFLLPASKKKWISKQCKSVRLPFARVPLSLDDDDDKEKMQNDDKIVSKASPDILSSVSIGQTLSTQCNLDVSFHKENNQNVNDLDHSEDISSIVDVLPKESHSHSNQYSKSLLVSEMRNAPFVSHRKEKPSPTNVDKRKKCGSSWESPVDTPCVTDLDQQQILSPELKWNNEINDYTNEKNITIQRNRQCLPDISSEFASKPSAECMSPVKNNDDLQEQKTVYDDDMDLTASEISKIITVSRGTKNKSNIKPNDCGKKTFRKVKDSSSDKKRERSKKKCKKSSDVDVEERIENRPEKSVVLDGKRDSEDPNFICNTEHLIQANIVKKTTLQNSFDQDDGQNTHYNEKERGMHVTNEHKFLQDSKLDMGQDSLTYNKSKASIQTFVMHKLEKDNLFPDQKNKETISENLEVANKFQRADISSQNNGNFCDYETQNMLDTDMHLAQQNESKINNKLRQKVNRKTEIISEVNQIYEANDKGLHVPEKGNFFPQTQVVKETFSENLAVSKDFQIPAFFMKGNGNIHDYETQNVLGLQKQITSVYPVQQNESKVNKKLRQKIIRRTEIISEVNHFENDKSVHCPEKGDPFFLQKDKEAIPRNLKDSNEFQTPVLCTRKNRELCEYETQNVPGMRRHIHDVQLACQNDSKVDKKLRQKAHRKTEIMSKVNQICENNDKGMHDLEKDNFVSLTPKNKETISENLAVANEFPAADFPTKDNGNLYDYEIQNDLDLKKLVANMQLVQQNESKINKKRKQKVNRKTEIISEVNQLYEPNDKDVHDQKSYTEDLDLKANKSKQRLECEGIISGYYMEINSNEKESCNEFPDLYKLVNKHKTKSSGKAKNFLIRDKNKSICQLIDSSLSSLKHSTNEADSDPGKQTEPPKNHKQSTITLNTKRDVTFVEVIKEKCEVKKVNKRTSKSKKRKTLEDHSSGTSDVVEIIPDIDHRKSFDSEQANKENYLEKDSTVKIKPYFHTNVFKSLAQIYSPNIQDSSFDNVRGSSIPLSISSSKNLMIKETFPLENLSIFQVSDDVHEKIKEISQQTGKSGRGSRTLQDLTNTSFVSNNTAKSKNDIEDLSSEMPSRRRRCAPVSFKEPSLKKQKDEKIR